MRPRSAGRAAPLLAGAAVLAGAGFVGVAATVGLADDRAPPPPLDAAATAGKLLRLPPGFPAPVVPADNPLTAAKVALGRLLFYDQRLSGDGDYACASCHRQELAFTDGRPRAVGTTGELHRRSAPSLANVAYAASLGWSDPALTRLEDQVRVPLLWTDPVELGVAGREVEAARRRSTLNHDPAGRGDRHRGEGR